MRLESASAKPHGSPYRMFDRINNYTIAVFTYKTFRIIKHGTFSLEKVNVIISFMSQIRLSFDSNAHECT